MRILPALSLLLLTLCGCASTGAPKMPMVSPEKLGRVYLIRGMITPLSFGMDRLARELRDAGFKASTHSHLQSGQIAAAIERDKREAGHREPLILIGYSTGAINACRVARRLERSDIPVDLLVMLDTFPVSNTRVPPNVRSCVSYYHRYAPGIPLLAGRPVKAENPSATKVVNIDFTRNESRHGFLNHFVMDEQPAIYREIIGKALEVCPPK